MNAIAIVQFPNHCQFRFVFLYIALVLVILVNDLFSTALFLKFFYSSSF